MRLLSLKFRTKLLLAMVLVVGGVSAVTLATTQRRVQANYEHMFRRQFDRQISYFTSLQEARLAAYREQCLKLTKSVRLISAMSEPEVDVADLYKNAEDELREVLGETRQGGNERRPGAGRQGGGGGGPRRQQATFFRFIDAKGQPLVPPELTQFGPTARTLRRLEERLAPLRTALSADDVQQVGYIAVGMTTNRQSGLRDVLAGSGRNLPAARRSADPFELQEVIFTKIVDPVGEKVLGALVIGFPLPSLIPQPRGAIAREAARTNALESIQTGILLDSHLFAEGEEIGTALAAVLTASVTNRIQTRAKAEADYRFTFGGLSYRVFYRLMNENSVLPPAYQVCLYSMTEAEKEMGDLRLKVLGSAAGALLIGILVSLGLSHGLSAPIHDLVKGTGEIRRGNFGVRVPVRSRDEVGELAGSFNEMADGLAQKEKYRTVLNMVADERVAQQLVAGELTLGGELREITVLFCDIRGFTALTQNMAPGEVIAMLNEHMTALWQVVREHHGVLDKFVGDLLMAIFGAPLHHNNDTLNAVSCALGLLNAREELNRTSRHQLQVGIGLATGTVVAGCMGSADRLNYTVLGERVNLASRLCARAAAGEVLIDDNTCRKLGDFIVVESKGEMELKGFSAPVQAFKLTGLNAPATSHEN